MKSALRQRTRLALGVFFWGGSFVACRSAPESAPPAPAEAAPVPAADAPSAASDAPSEAAELGAHRVPLRVKLDGPDHVEVGQDVEIVATIEQRTGDKVPVELALAVPKGTQLVSGSSSEQLTGQNATVERRFVVHIDALPTEDFELVAHAGNDAFGAHAKGVYRFGRSAPKFPELPRAPNDVVIGGKNLGKPIQLTKP